MENKIKEIIKWFKKYNNSEIKIVSETKEFSIKININALPHLLGLQYAYENPTNMKGKNILRQFKKENYSDIDILKNIERNNPEKIDSVKDRIKYFKKFMENLEKSTIVEMTNPKTRLKSNYLMIHTDDNTIMQLGIKNLDYEDVFETFIVRQDDDYFKDTTINEQVISIEKYNENGELEPFSFKEDIEKAKEINLNIIENKTQKDKKDTKVQDKIKSKSSEMVRPSLLKRIKEKHNILNNGKELDKTINDKDKNETKLKNKNER